MEIGTCLTYLVVQRMAVGSVQGEQINERETRLDGTRAPYLIATFSESCHIIQKVWGKGSDCRRVGGSGCSLLHFLTTSQSTCRANEGDLHELDERDFD